MINIFKRIAEYVVRHLGLNAIGIKIIDSIFEDRTGEKTSDAKKLLRSEYEPAVFSAVNHPRTIRHIYNLQIIIPVYNMRSYIGKCLDSILSQKTEYSYIVYLIDDGSTDGTLEYAKSLYDSEKIVFISKDNGGTASARNIALDNMVADYIMFVDADDMLKQNAIDNLLKVAYKEDAEIVEGGYEEFRNKVVAVKNHVFERVESPCGTLWGFTWGKVFKSELFEKFRFPDNYWYEDTFISYLIYTKCEKAITIDSTVYSYRRNINGMSRIRRNEKKMLDAFWIINLVIEEMLREKIAFTQSIYEQLLISIITSSKRILFLDSEVRQKVLSAYSELLHDYFDGYRTNVDSMKIFEKVIRNNDYRKYRLITICLEEL